MLALERDAIAHQQGVIFLLLENDSMICLLLERDAIAHQRGRSRWI
jgi:hypothetical protein